MKKNKIINIIATVIPVLLLAMSAIMKFTGAPEVVATLSKDGVGSLIPVLGIMELSFTLLFAFPKTMRLGFILISCYLAGAIATDLSHNGNFAGPLVPLILVWISTFIRDRSVFLPAASKKVSIQ